MSLPFFKLKERQAHFFLKKFFPDLIIFTFLSRLLNEWKWNLLKKVLVFIPSCPHNFFFVSRQGWKKWKVCHLVSSIAVSVVMSCCHKMSRWKVKRIKDRNRKNQFRMWWFSVASCSFLASLVCKVACWTWILKEMKKGTVQSLSNSLGRRWLEHDSYPKNKFYNSVKKSVNWFLKEEF